MRNNPKRLNWNDYFMGIAMMTAMRSPDPSTQVGCIAVKDKRIISTGYNGYPSGVEPFTWDRKTKDFLKSKYSYVVHSEVNMVLNAERDNLVGSTAYMTLFPCNVCAGIMISAGISKIIYSSDKYHDMEFSQAARILLDKANVPYHFYSGKIDDIVIETKPIAGDKPI